MPLVPLEIQPGVYRNGTDLQSQNRWRDASLVRWTDNTLRPVGGWEQKSQTAAASKIRALLAWVDNSNGRRFVAGTYNKLYAYTQSGVQADITPAGFTAGRIDASAFTGTELVHITRLLRYRAYRQRHYTSGNNLVARHVWAKPRRL